MVGNIPNFTKLDVLRCLFHIEEPVSRLRLSEKLELGEGTIRSILEILKEKHLLTSTNQGHILSSDGRKMLGSLKRNLEVGDVDLKDLFPKKKCVAAWMKDSDVKKWKAYQLRDEAVKSGAEGALILAFDEKLKLYDWPQSDEKYDFSVVESKFDLERGDMVVVSYADSCKLAEYGCLAVAILVNGDLKKALKKL